MGKALKRVAVRTSLFYALFAALWILLSGAAMAAFVHDPGLAQRIEIYKGLVFVVVTSFLLYAVSSRQMRWLEREAEARREAEELTRGSQERFLKIFRSSPMGITLSRFSDGKLIDANPAVLRTLGYSRTELLSHSSQEIGIWASQEERDRLVGLMKAHGRVEGVELRFRKKSGEIGTMFGSAEMIDLAGENHLLSMMVDITDKRRAEEARKASENLYQAVFDHCVAGLAIIEEDGTIGLANENFSKALGYSREEIEGKMNWMSVPVPEDLERLKELHCARMAGSNGKIAEFECRIRKSDGAVTHRIARIGMIPGTNRSIFSGLDITARKAAEEALKESESRFKSAFETSAIGMALVALDGKFLKVNRSLCRSLGYSEEELLYKTFQEITYPEDLEKDLDQAGRLVRDDITAYSIEKRCINKEGFVVWGNLSASVVRDAESRPLYFVCQIEDITERKLLEEKLRKLLVTDELTGLYNRRGFVELSREQLRLATRKKDRLLLFFFDLDHMKRINDTLGHHEGDRALVNAAQVLKETFRESDIIGRMGGDEFAVLAIETSESTKEAILSRLHANLAKDRGDLSLFMSAGCSEYEPDRPRTVEALLAEADASMYEVKQKKKDEAPVHMLASDATLL